MPRKGYRSITIREDLYREIEASAKAAGASVPRYVEALYRTENGNDSDSLEDCTVQCTVHVPYNADSRVSVPYNVPYMYRTENGNENGDLVDGPENATRARPGSHHHLSLSMGEDENARAREEPVTDAVSAIVAAWSEAAQRSPLIDAVTVTRPVLDAVTAHPEVTIARWLDGITMLAAMPEDAIRRLRMMSLHQAMATSPAYGVPKLAALADGVYEQDRTDNKDNDVDEEEWEDGF